MLVADKRRKEPRTLPRPWEKRKGKPRPAPGVVRSAEGGMTATGLSGMLTATQMRGAVSIG